jgi:hypothetical protein
VCLSAFVSLSGERDQIAEQTYGADSERLSVQRHAGEAGMREQ